MQTLAKTSNFRCSDFKSK